MSLWSSSFFVIDYSFQTFQGYCRIECYIDQNKYSKDGIFFVMRKDFEEKLSYYVE